jgi:aspartyl-tRNA(Asn)/glutamyl-tRNA(Gln) amidotransferase subunit B
MAGTRVVKAYKVLVGMEIHVQLATRSKMFAGAANGFGGEPNSQVDPVVMGLPGTLPVMNRRAVEYSIKVGLALGCKIARHTKWDRKSYYYPDLPKNYQISQYDEPLCHEGEFELAGEGGPVRVRIRRAHLEEDAGKLMHDAPGGFAIDHSIVDLNRAGTPLLEIVTEPDLSSPRDVALFGQELQKIVQFLGVSEAQMQMGHMRFEPNINVHITDGEGAVHKTAITEIKNLNSFSVLERATAYEVHRQVTTWQETGSLGKKSTYGWDEGTGRTFHQRDKEEANDYRYFPDPDLVPVEVSDEWLAEIKAGIGEMPAARLKRYTEALGLPAAVASILAGDRRLGDYFDEAVRIEPKPKRIGDLMVNQLAQVARNHEVPAYELSIEPARFAQLASLVEQGTIAASRFVEVLELIEEKQHITEENLRAAGLIQSNDLAPIDAAIDVLIAQNPKSLQDYKGGKQAALGSLVGMILKSSKGLSAKVVQERLRERLAQS